MKLMLNTGAFDDGLWEDPQRKLMTETNGETMVANKVLHTVNEKELTSQWAIQASQHFQVDR